MANYKITNVAAGKCLNIYGDNVTNLSNNQNVTIWADSGSDEQTWVIDSLGAGVLVKSYVDNRFALNAYRSSTSKYNCDVYPWSGNETDAKVNFVATSGGYRIKLANYNMYLTAGGTANGADVYWAAATGGTNQVWTCTQVNSGSVVSGQAYASVCTGASTLTSAQMASNAKYICHYLMSQGFTKNAACGVLGNMQQESGLNPGIWQYTNNVSQGYGLVQWTPATTFLDRAVATGVISTASAAAINAVTTSNPKKLMDAELSCLIWCCTSRHDFFSPSSSSSMNHTGHFLTFSQFKASTLDAGTLAKVFHDHYERSADNATRLEQRATYARNWYAAL